MSTAKWQNIAGSKKFFSYGRLFLEKLKKRPMLELVSKELNHLAAILHVYAGGLIFMK
jgi:hypothetical protein